MFSRPLITSLFLGHCHDVAAAIRARGDITWYSQGLHFYGLKAKYNVIIEL